MSLGLISPSYMSALDFERFRDLAYREFGLDLPDGKQPLVAARLAKKLKELNLSTYCAYYHHVVEDRTGDALAAMIDALTTNHTSFFREPAHFDFLGSTVVPPLVDRTSIPIWSAACSTGEEPYSIAFTLFDILGVESLAKVRIAATDISTRVLRIAQTAVYPADRFEGLPAERLRRYVLRGEGRRQDTFLIKKTFRSAIGFSRLNLMDDFSHLGLFKVIFCRNVMIYFDRKTQENLVNRLAQQLEPGGFLFIGHSESLNGIEHPLNYVCPAIYRNLEHPRSNSGVKK